MQKKRYGRMGNVARQRQKTKVDKHGGNTVKGRQQGLGCKSGKYKQGMQRKQKICTTQKESK